MSKIGERTSFSLEVETDCSGGGRCLVRERHLIPHDSSSFVATHSGHRTAALQLVQAIRRLTLITAQSSL